MIKSFTVLNVNTHPIVTRVSFHLTVAENVKWGRFRQKEKPVGKKISKISTGHHHKALVIFHTYPSRLRC